MERNRKYQFDFGSESATTESIQDLEPASEEVEYQRWKRPPGIVGDIADFIYSAAPSPLIEVALAGAIAYMAGIVGRAYNVAGMGLNQYIVVLADTGAGKNAAKTGIDKLNAAVAPLLLPGIPLRKGLGVIPSPQGLLRSFVGDGKDPNTSRLCCLSVMGEVGIWLQELCDKKADANKKGLRRLLLDLYTASGGSKRSGDVGYSDSVKNFGEMIAVAFSLLGDSTQHHFYKAVNEDSVAEGFLTRLTLVEYKSHKLPKPNLHHDSAVPNSEMLQRISDLLKIVIDVERMADSTRTYNWINIPSNEAALHFSIHLQNEIRQTMEQHNRNAEGHLSGIWSRFPEKTLRLAAVLAVGVNPHNPQITLTEMEWAHDLVMRGTQILIERFESGHVGEVNPHILQHEQFLACLKKYRNNSWISSFERNYGITKDHKANDVVTYRYIHNMLHKRPAFCNSHNTKQALANMIEVFENEGFLIKVRDRGMEQYRGNSTALMWIVVNIGK